MKKKAALSGSVKASQVTKAKQRRGLPPTAETAGNPAAIVGIGAFVLPADRIAAELAAIGRHPLESSNEELVTLNEQILAKNTELGQITDDLTNVLSSVNIPILMVGGDGRVRRFTPTAEKLLNMAPGDIGRPMRGLRMGLDVPGLDSMIAAVMATGSERRTEVKADSGRWFSVRLFPFMTNKQQVEGVLLAFVDVDDLKQGQQALQSEMKLTSAILEAAASNLLVDVRDREGRTVHFNRACQNLTGYTQAEVKGKMAWDFLVPAEDIATAKLAFDAVRADTPTRGEYHWITRDGRSVQIAWSFAVTSNDEGFDYIIGTGIDVSDRHAAKQEAVEKDATVRALLKSVPQSILAVNVEGRIVFVNTAAESMFGYSREELERMQIEILVPQRLRGEHVHRRGNWFVYPDSRIAIAARELVARRKDGSEFPVEIALSPVPTKDGMLAVSFVTDITERKKVDLELRTYQKQLQDLAARLLSVQESESKIVARELHDDLSQRLAALGMEISSLPREAMTSPKQYLGRFQDLGRRISALGEDVHRMSRQLHSAILDDLGLQAALGEECRGLAQKLGIPVEFTTEDVPSPLDAAISLCLFRVTQESLRNIGKHSGAREVRVRLARIESNLLLVIDDVGEGFDLEVIRGKGGLGLISMKERVQLVDGDFKIHSEPGKGTRIEARVPLQKTPS